MFRGYRLFRSASPTLSNKDKGSRPSGGWETRRIRVVTGMG